MRLVRAASTKKPLFNITWRTYAVTAVASWFVGIYSFEPFLVKYFQERDGDSVMGASPQTEATESAFNKDTV